MTRSALSLGLIFFASLACASVGGVEAQRPYPDSRAHGRPPMVSVWMAGSNLFRHGDRRPIHFRSDRDAYVTVARLDTDGRITVLYPESPGSQRLIRGGRTYTLNSSSTFRVNDRTGLGYVFAIASHEPFDYSRIARGRRWDYMHVRHARYDPYEAMYDLAEMIVWDRRTRYSLDYAEYHVGRVVSYPRYMCIEAYGGDPYFGCRRFALVYRQSPYQYGYGPYYGYPDRAVMIRQPQRYGRIEQRPPQRPGGAQPVDAVDRRRRDADDRDRRNEPADPRRRDAVEAGSQTGAGTGLPSPRRVPDNQPRTDARDDVQTPRVIRPEPRRATEPQGETRGADTQAEDRGDPRATPRRVPDTRTAPARDTEPRQAQPQQAQPQQVQPQQAQPQQGPRAAPQRREPEQRSNQRSEERREESSSDAQNSRERRRRSPE